MLVYHIVRIVSTVSRWSWNWRNQYSSLRLRRDFVWKGRFQRLEMKLHENVVDLEGGRWKKMRAKRMKSGLEFVQNDGHGDAKGGKDCLMKTQELFPVAWSPKPEEI